MKILFLGDVMGRSGRDGLAENLPKLKALCAPDFIIVNGENAAGGYGLNRKIAEEFKGLGVDVVTTGNHVWDQREFIQEIDSLPYVLRPQNLTAETPGKGAGIFTAKNGKRVLVIHVLGQRGMQPCDNPFVAIDDAIKNNPGANATVVDIHGEFTSERMALGHHLDGRASLVVGTHTHIPTADTQILPNGTGYQTDAGMCGDYDSVIGMNKAEAVFRARTHLPTVNRMRPAEGPATLCGVMVTTDDTTGLTTKIEPVRIGGRLSQAIPTA